MNPLSRLLATVLFVVLATLAALLVVPLAAPVDERSPAESAATAQPATRSRGGSAVVLSQRAALGLALLAAGLTAALLFSISSRRHGASDTSPPFAAARQEISTLSRLAETSVAREQELARERDVRRLAEEDAQLKQRLLAQSVEEKIQLGRDLHDGIIQSLYAVGLMLETIRPLLRTDTAAAEARLDQVRNSLNVAIREVRSYITGLAPENLRRASFARTVTPLFEELRAGRQAGIEINIDEHAAARLNVDQNLEALQIAREAISNALRHGQAGHITVRMHQGDGEVCLLIQDNGAGFDATTRSGTGFGLANMEARARRLGAHLRITSEPGRGTRVVANFPLSPDEAPPAT